MLKLAVLAALILGACVSATDTRTHGSFSMTAAQSTVVINGVELTAAQEDELATLLGERVPPGRYYVTDNGMMGIEGQPPSVNLVAIIEARGGSSQPSQSQHAARGSIHNSSGDSHITSDGNGCTILSTPSGSLSSGC